MANKSSNVWIFILIIMVVVLLICFSAVSGLLWYLWVNGMFYSLKTGPAEAPEPPRVEAPEPRQAPAYPERPGSSGVTLANFDKIKIGMTYSEVAAIFGCDGTPMELDSLSGRDYKLYEWEGPYGGKAEVRFLDGGVYSAEQDHLR